MPLRELEDGLRAQVERMSHMLDVASLLGDRFNEIDARLQLVDALNVKLEDLERLSRRFGMMEALAEKLDRLPDPGRDRPAAESAGRIFPCPKNRRLQGLWACANRKRRRCGL